MLVQRLTPEEFKAEYRRRGWSGKDLAAHWGKHTVSLSKIGNDPDRPKHWDDAVRGLAEYKQLAYTLVISSFKLAYRLIFPSLKRVIEEQEHARYIDFTPYFKVSRDGIHRHRRNGQCPS